MNTVMSKLCRVNTYTHDIVLVQQVDSEHSNPCVMLIVIAVQDVWHVSEFWHSAYRLGPVSGIEPFCFGISCMTGRFGACSLFLIFFQTDLATRGGGGGGRERSWVIFFMAWLPVLLNQ